MLRKIISNVNFSYKYNLASKLLRPFIQFIDKADDMTRTLENLVKALNLVSLQTVSNRMANF